MFSSLSFWSALSLSRLERNISKNKKLEMTDEIFLFKNYPNKKFTKNKNQRLNCSETLKDAWEKLPKSILLQNSSYKPELLLPHPNFVLHQFRR